LNFRFKLGILQILIFYLFITPCLSSQTKLLQRKSSQIPENYRFSLINEHRKLVSLNGEWDLASADPEIRTKVQVPFSYDFRGKAICKRTFDLNFENPQLWNYVLNCDGINYQCEILINGKFIDKHEGGYAPFSALIQEGIIENTGNTIEIKIDNTLDYSKTLPLKNINNYPKNYGGIYRDIYIIAVPKIFIRNINLNSEIDINFNADITNNITITATDITAVMDLLGDGTFSVRTEILDSAGNVKGSSSDISFTISQNSTLDIKNELTATNPQFWSPDYPYLHKIKVILSKGEKEIDLCISDYGVYELTQKSSSIIMNGADLKLRGINYVEEFPGAGISGSYGEIERDVKEIKSLGCNVIKLHGRPASPYLIKLCNIYGLLIFEEIPVFNVPAGIISQENFYALAGNQFKEMILAHKNNPSVFAYGLGNDFDVSDEKTRIFISKLYALGKSLDNRLIYYSTRNFKNDICRDQVDFVGINYYDKDLSAIKEIVSDSRLKKQKIFVANYGKIINPSNFSGYSDPASLESQSKYIVDFQKIVKKSSLLGSFFVSYTDWNSDFPNLKFFDRSNQYMRTSGLYSLYREQRSPAIILKKEYLDEDLPNLNIGTYSKEAPIAFVLMGLFTFILFIYLANSVRRFRENVWRAMFRPFIFFTDIREQSLFPALQNTLLAIIISIGNALFFANLFYFWRDSQLFDIMFSLLISSDSLKETFDTYFISPVKLVVLFTSVSMIKIFLIAVIIWLFSLTSKFKIGFNNIYTVTVWGFLPTIALMIIGIFFIRVLYLSPDFVIIGMAAAGFFYLISFYRILKGTYIIFDTFFLKAYSYGIITILVICGGVWFYLDNTKFITDYFDLIFSFLKN